MKKIEPRRAMCLQGTLPVPEGAENYCEEHEHGDGYCRLTQRWKEGGKSVVSLTSIQTVAAMEFPAPRDSSTLTLTPQEAQDGDLHLG